MAGPLSRVESRLGPRETTERRRSGVQIFLSGKFTLYTSRPPRRRPRVWKGNCIATAATSSTK